MNNSARIALAGFLATGVAFGPARMGYGLFLPQFRDTFGLSIETAGFIASGAYGAFLVSLVLTGYITSRFGPRIPVVIGGVAAALGMGIVSLAPTGFLLALGVVLASSSAGFCWTPYNNAAGRAVPPHLQGRVLSVVSTGTTFGVAAAAILAFLIVFGHGWRLTWGVFAACGLTAAGINAIALRGIAGFKVSTKPANTKDGWGARALLNVRALPLFGVGLSFGATATVHLSFAVDRIVHSGGLPGIPAEAVGPMFFLIFGGAGSVGLFTGEMEKKLGIMPFLRLIFVCSALSMSLIALVPDSWVSVVLSAALQGACLMTISAILAFWSLRIFPSIPAVSFTAVLLFLAAGNMIGPALASVLAGRFNMGTAFLAFGGLSLLTAFSIPRDRLEK